MARPRAVINWSDVEKLCALQATEEEIAQFIGVSVDTLCRACQREYKTSFAEYFKQKRGPGRISLRRAQWQLAQSGNATMLIWLGKQYLGQTDQPKAVTLVDDKGNSISPTGTTVIIGIPSNGYERKD